MTELTGASRVRPGRLSQIRRVCRLMTGIRSEEGVIRQLHRANVTGARSHGAWHTGSGGALGPRLPDSASVRNMRLNRARAK